MVAGMVTPLQAAVRIQSVEVVIPAADVDGAVGSECCGAVDVVGQVVMPLFGAIGVDGEDTTLGVTDVNGAVRGDNG